VLRALAGDRDFEVKQFRKAIAKVRMFVDYNFDFVEWKGHRLTRNVPGSKFSILVHAS
jgi:hypothetical protein